MLSLAQVQSEMANIYGISDFTFSPFVGESLSSPLDGSDDVGRPYDSCSCLCGGGFANADDGA